MKKVLILLPAILFITNAFAQGQSNKDNVAIQKVLHTFMHCIIKKDTTALLSLFASNIPIAWVDVQGKETLAISKKEYATAAPIETGNYKSFIRYIGTSKNALEEKFYNVKIRTDGLLATVSFDYSFWSNEKKENWGQENWELVFDGTDWKIAGVYFSYTLESVTKQP